MGMTKPMVHLTKKAREFRKVRVFLKTRGHLVVNPLQIIQPMTIRMQSANRSKHKEEKKRLFKLKKKEKKKKLYRKDRGTKFGLSEKITYLHEICIFLHDEIRNYCF